MKRARATTWGRRVLVGLVGSTVFAVAWSRVSDVRLRGAFDDALTDAPAAASTSTDPFAGDSSTLTLGVLSYNAWALPVPLPGMARRARLPRMPAALSAEGADIIALQEAFDVRFRAFVTSYFAQTHPIHRSTPCQRSIARLVRADCVGGLLTLTRFPVVRQRFQAHALTEGMRSDERLGGKGIMVSTLETPIGAIDVVNLHLYAGRDAADEAQRLIQVRDLATALEAHGSLDRPLVLLGDLNVVHSSLASDGAPSPAFAFLLDSLGFFDVAPASAGTRFTYDAETNPYADLWYNRFEGRQIFDYIMVRLPPGFELEVGRGHLVLTGPDALSDHFGVFTELSISKVGSVEAQVDTVSVSGDG